MIIPQLHNGQYALFMADGLTGHVLTVEGKVSIDARDQIFMIFESIAEAYSFVKHNSELNNTVEYCIYNDKQELIQYINAPAYK